MNWLIIICLYFFHSGSPIYGENKPSAVAIESLYQQALHTENPDTAVNLFKKIIQTAPQHPLAAQALFEIAQYNYAIGYYHTAIQLYQDLINTYPNSKVCHQAIYWCAASYLAIRQPSKARQMYEKYLARYSALTELVHLGIGDSYFIEKEYEKALRAYQMLIRLYPQGSSLPAAYKRMADCYRILGRDDKAQELENKLKQKYPQSIYTQLVKPTATITQINPIPETPEPAQQNYVIQVGSYSQQNNALALKMRLKKLGYPVKISVKIINAQQYYRVWVGPYPDKKTAKKIANKLKAQERLEYLIKKYPEQ